MNEPKTMRTVHCQLHPVTFVQVALAAFGLAMGTLYGFGYFGALGLIVGGIIGIVAGNATGVKFERESDRIHKLTIPKMSPVSLKAALGLPRWNTIHINYLVELANRGENVEAYLARIFGMLKEDSGFERTLGWDLLRSAYPEIAGGIAGYDPKGPAEVCRKVIENFESKKAPAN